MVGNQIKTIRKEKPMTLAELSQKSKLPISMLSFIENNKRTPTIESLQKICNGLDISFSRFLLLWSISQEELENNNLELRS